MEIPAKIQIKHLGNLERIHRQNLKFIDQADVRGVWILRAPGVGKIHFARQVLVAEGVGGGRPFFLEPVFSPGTAALQYYRGAVPQ